MHGSQCVLRNVTEHNAAVLRAFARARRRLED